MDYSFTTGVTDAEKEIIKNLCAVTYRGYNYDFDTELYYLQSRFYNPYWGRFLNVDDTAILLSTTGTLHGANLYIYCDNNPVNKVDYSGFKASENEMVKTITEIIIALSLLCDSIGDRADKIIPSTLLSSKKCSLSLKTRHITLTTELPYEKYLISFYYDINDYQKGCLSIEIRGRTARDWEFTVNTKYYNFINENFGEDIEMLSYGLSEMPSEFLQMISLGLNVFSFGLDKVTNLNANRDSYYLNEVKKKTSNPNDYVNILEEFSIFETESTANVSSIPNNEPIINPSSNPDIRIIRSIKKKGWEI